jgi:hypothetical protein
MHKTLIGFVMLAMLAGVATLVAVGGASDTEPAPLPVEAKPAPEPQPGTVEPPATPVGGVPDCPTPSPCSGGSYKCRNDNPCKMTTTETGSFDTGSATCNQPGGGTKSCLFPGETVHLVTYSCEQCQCCNDSIPCVCPQDCGEASILDCR